MFSPAASSLEAPYISIYNHINGKVSAIVAFNKEVPEEMGHEIAMQITAMNPIFHLLGRLP